MDYTTTNAVANSPIDVPNLPCMLVDLDVSKIFRIDMQPVDKDHAIEAVKGGPLYVYFFSSTNKPSVTVRPITVLKKGANDWPFKAPSPFVVNSTNGTVPVSGNKIYVPATAPDSAVLISLTAKKGDHSFDVDATFPLNVLIDPYIKIVN